MAEINSPCVRNCCLDTQDICLGCFRSIREIMLWSNSTTSSQKKQQILNNANARKKERQIAHG